MVKVNRWIGISGSAKIPKIIEDVGFDFHWDEEKVWALGVPIDEIPISELDWHLDIPFWNKPNGYYDLTPNQVLNNPNEYKEEFKRVTNANLKHPLDIMYWKDKWLMLDGLHRLAKAKQLGMTVAKVRKIPIEAIPLIKKII